MRTFLVLAALGASALASETVNERNIHYPANILEKRQQFAPSTQMATGDSCAAAFGTGYITCREKTSSTNRLCYNPDINQSCCQASWACPSGSECLPDPGQCCPNGSCEGSGNTRIVVEGNVTSTITASRTSTATGVVSVTGFRNSTASTTKASNTGSAPKSSSTATGAAATPIAGTLLGLMGLAAAML